ncbi:MAG: pyridoxal phosphate-dependent aminotransferase [Alphaproteobacteria bacterium]|nr:pyridoxal phosphate-dependent aminotransferase [Alphaproteobacteria bacterium]
MTRRIARRAGIPPFIVMDVLRAANKRAATGADVLHLEVGQPSTGAPVLVVEAARAALGRDVLGYTDALGIPPLRQAISRHYHERYGVDVDAARIVVTTGSSGAFILSFLAAFDQGARVAVTAPGYPAYRNILSALGIEVVEIEVGDATRYQPTPALLDKAGRLDGLIVASPANPTGTMLTAEDLKVLADHCARRDIRLVSDEIYHGITYREPATTALALTERAVVINSFSKYFSMTGWRLGWMVLPEELIRPVECLAQNLFISPPSLSQVAAVAVFGCRDELEANVRRYAANRAVLLESLPKAGLDRFAPPDGAFYLYVDIGHVTNDSADFCKRVLAEIGVAITPGIDFDPSRGSRTLRISFAGSTETMAEAARRLGAWLKR